jgi:hypothetical protein
VIADGGAAVFRSDPNLTPRQRRALIRRAMLRPAITAGFLLALYAVVPLSDFDRRRNLILLIGALVVFGLVATWQVKRILDSDRPVLQAAEALAVVLPLYLLGLSAIYYVMEMNSPEQFSQGLSRVSAVYFTVTVFGTVGFGDITPTTDVARAIVTGQIVFNLFIIGIGGRILFAAVQHGLQRRETGATGAESAERPGGTGAEPAEQSKPA